jgi:hypothetical protein
VTYAQRPFLFHNLGNGKFEEIGQNAGLPFTQRHVGRGAATADFFNDGKLNLLVSVLEGSPLMLRNHTSRAGHWLRIKTIGVKSNRDGFGARVEVKSAGLAQSAEVRANASFESASDPRLHFGLGSATHVDSIVVRWASGTIDRISAQDGDQELVIEEGKGLVKRVTGSQNVQKKTSTPAPK